MLSLAPVFSTLSTEGTLSTGALEYDCRHVPRPHTECLLWQCCAKLYLQMPADMFGASSCDEASAYSAFAVYC